MSKSKDGKKKSSIFSLFTRFSEFVYSKMPESLSARLLIGKQKSDNNGLFSTLKSKINFKKRVSLPVKRYIAKCFDNSFIISYVKKIISRVPDLQLKCVGIFYFALGLFSSLLQLVTTNVIAGGNPTPSLYMSIGACVVGGIFCGSQKTCYTAVYESRILSRIFFKFFNIKKNNAYLKNEPIGKSTYFLIAGVIGGIIASITSVPFALLIIPAVLAIYIVLAFPESGAVALFLIVPFVSYDKLAAACTLITLAWFIKLIRGKRVFKFSYLDLTVLAFAVAIILGGVVSVSPSDSISVVYTLLPMLGAYFAVSNLLRTTEWIRACGSALVISFSVSLIASTIGESFRLLPAARAEIFREIFSDATLSVLSINPVFIHMAVAILPLTVMWSISSRNGTKTAKAAIVILLTLGCLFFGGSRSGIFAALIGLTILLMLVSKRSLSYIIPTAIIAPLSFSLLPSSVTGAFYRLFSFDGAVASFRQSVSYTTNKIMSDSMLGGIGLGEGAFSKIYPLYTNDLSQKITHTLDLYSQITVSLGISGLIIFIVFIAQLLRRYFSYITACDGDDASLKATTVSMFAGLSALLIMGLTDYIWLSPSVFLLFWLMTALFMASIRTAEDDRYTALADGPTLEIDTHTLNHFSKSKG